MLATFGGASIFVKSSMFTPLDAKQLVLVLLGKARSQTNKHLLITASYPFLLGQQQSDVQKCGQHIWKWPFPCNHVKC